VELLDGRSQHRPLRLPKEHRLRPLPGVWA
jgi:hypothetical protein